MSSHSFKVILLHPSCSRIPCRLHTQPEIHAWVLSCLPMYHYADRLFVGPTVICLNYQLLSFEHYSLSQYVLPLPVVILFDPLFHISLQPSPSIFLFFSFCPSTPPIALFSGASVKYYLHLALTFLTFLTFRDHLDIFVGQSSP